MDPKIAEMLEKLAGKLGTTVEYLWPKMVGAERVEAICWMIGLCGLGFIIFFVCMVVSAYVNDVEEKWAMRAAGFIAGWVFALFSLAHVPDFVYPEAAAINYIVHGR
ncbi:MAG TPA: hypothetical protein VD994_07535 [Prosthecobacter sp.]|nr:hypothetical protein [Prosthecobacter sp.]